MKPLEQIKTDIETKIGTAVAIENGALILPAEKILTAAHFLKDDPDYRLDYLSCLTGVDYKTNLEVVYHLYSMQKKEGPVILKVRTDREKSLVPSVTPVWRGAEFQEREAYDLFGIHFEGHPDLRRILMWDNFEHYPLRKDYVPEDQNRAINAEKAT
jgi:NADH-quinone oxidoreductase subunit C